MDGEVLRTLCVYPSTHICLFLGQLEELRVMALNLVTPDYLYLLER